MTGKVVLSPLLKVKYNHTQEKPTEPDWGFFSSLSTFYCPSAWSLQYQESMRGEKKKPTPTWSIGSSTLVCYEKFERIETSQPLLV
ncbi:hypothetical protein HMPREF9303_2677 [Prevotella denticola CRIS 18C-A]|uniref:Uncharacterized protein n=1 Tax=Prevotella denticola CRIS 18C-A TaxID=944557 RepID=F0H925_9BACT|nr:hypothetical protein HMPREF9303_2677 [Prevotella denticola CRIS 18C-A]